MFNYLFRGRIVDPNGKQIWITGFYMRSGIRHYICEEHTLIRYEVQPETVGMFSQHCIKGKMLFAGDIVRNERYKEDKDDREYLVCVWIKEWTMFALIYDYEYQNYLKAGKEALDESMFWTFPIEDNESEQRTICGNIFDNPELLNTEKP